MLYDGGTKKNFSEFHHSLCSPSSARERLLLTVVINTSFEIVDEQKLSRCRYTHMHIFIARVADAYGICKSDYGTRCLVSITDILVIVATSKVTLLVLNRRPICSFSHFYFLLFLLLHVSTRYMFLARECLAVSQLCQLIPVVLYITYISRIKYLLFFFF